MEQKILVCYATGAGSTAEVAEFIGKELESKEALVDIQEVSEVTDLASYSSVILGSSIRFGRWLPEAIDFLDRFSDDLVERPVAYFMTCLSIIQSSERLQETAQAYWTPILSHDQNIEPVGLGLFAGSLLPELHDLNEYQDSVYGDHRDWETIRAWTHEILPALLTAKPRSSVPLILTGTILSYTDLSGYDLSRFDFQDSELVQTRLKDAKLEETDLRRAKLEAADLRGANFSKAQLGWADLHEAQCQQADFSEANLMGVNLDHANMQEVNLSHAILNGAILSHANFQAANLNQTDLNWADLRKSDLTDANLSEAHLGWANLTDANLSGANLAGAHYNFQTKWPSDFSPEQAGCILLKKQPG